MASTEPARHALYSRLEDVLGTEHAETLMTHLPRDRADVVVTKSDVERLEARFERLEARFDHLEQRLNEMQRIYVVTTVGSLTGLTAIFSLIVTLLA